MSAKLLMETIKADEIGVFLRDLLNDNDSMDKRSIRLNASDETNYTLAITDLRKK